MMFINYITVLQAAVDGSIIDNRGRFAPSIIYGSMLHKVFSDMLLIYSTVA